jgi:LuxR family maltose regulon positive regulatory protein
MLRRRLLQSRQLSMLAISQRHPRTILRRRLLDALQRWQELRLVRVVAPAGYGKTSLVTAWLQQLAELPDDQRPAVAWLSLFADIDAGRYVRSLIETLQPTLPNLQTIVAPASSGEISPAQAVAALCHELAAAPRPIVLVVDDVHWLSDPSLHALTQQILDHGSDRLHLVLLSRTSPPLQITELILEDAVLTLTERDLAFDHDEFVAFSQLIGLDTQPIALLDNLEQRCSGWVTGLKLLSYDILHPLPGHTQSAVAPFSSPTAENAIRHFLETRVLTQLAAPLRDFALAAAPLPWITPDLMAAVLDWPVDDCQQQILDLAAAVGFLSEFDAAGERRFRFHPLFHDALRSVAVTHGPQHAQRRRAAAWLLARDDVDAAFAILSPDIAPACVADDIAAAVHRALLRFDLVAARRWLEALPADLLESHTPLALAAAWLAFLSESVPQLDAAALRCTPRQDLLLDLAVLECYQHLLHERRDNAIRCLAEAEALASPRDSLGTGYLRLMRVLLPHNPDDVVTRTHELQSAADIFERIDFDYGVIQMMFAKSVLKCTFGDLRGALADSDFLQGFAYSHSRQRHRILRDDLRQRGEHLYLLNRIAEAREAMQSILDTRHQIQEDDGNDYIAALYLALCDVAEGIERPAEPRRDAEQWAQILANNFAGSLGYIAWPRILRDFRAGNLEHCWQTVESLCLSLDELDDHTYHTMRRAVLGGTVLTQRDHPSIAAHLDTFLDKLTATANHLLAQQVRLLRILHARQIGDDALALQRLQELLPLIERSGALRLILDFPDLQPLLARCDSPFARRTLTLFSDTTPAPIFGLTPQEIRILEQLTAGHTTKQIAAAHTVTLKTIYTHIHNIFRKLGVHSREEAVQVWTRSES